MSTRQTAVSTAIQKAIAEAEVDTYAIVNLNELTGTALEKAALKLLPETCSIVVLAMEIHPEILSMVIPRKEIGTASLRDLFAPHLEHLNGRITRGCHDVASASHEQGFKALILPPIGCPTDARFLESVFSFKHAAQAAKLGTIGWNGLLITDKYGPRVRLGCVLTEACLDPTSGSIPTFDCNKCQICIRKCPAHAIAKPSKNQQYSINKFACNTFRNAAGECVECMRLCPMASK